MSFPSAPRLRGIEKFAPPPSDKTMIYRGQIVNPLGPNETEHRYFPDGGLAVRPDGTILIADEISKVARIVERRYEVVDEETNGERPVIVPAFSDVHVHSVQNGVRGQFRGQLLPWLQQNIWPEEARFADPAVAEQGAKQFFADLARSGTVIAAIYSSIHEEALRAAFREAVGHTVIGNVLMTNNSPPYLQQNPGDALSLTDRLAGEFGSSYAVTPRFAITCDADTMRRAGGIARRNDSWVQTHLSENTDEVEWIKKLFPEARNYTDVYDRAGLLGRNAIMAHVIHADDSELIRLAQTGTSIAHCPRSNEALESGRMPLKRIRDHGIMYALGSDVGAGPSLSMLHVMQGYLGTHRGLEHVFPTEALYRATLAGAEVLALDRKAGNFDEGKEANFVTVRSPGTNDARNADQLLEEILSGSQADLESAVQRTYLAGRRIF